MLAENIQPDNMLLLGVLTACSHAGLLMEGIHIFHQMKRFHEIEANIEHYCCLVDLLGRAGLLDYALSVIESIPLKSCPALWGSLLFACQKHQNVSMAEIAAQNLMELKADDCGTYVLFSKVYADIGLQGESLRIWDMMKNKKMKKEIGSSSIEVDGNIKEFVSGECDLSQELKWFIFSLFSVATDL
ncbi:hypothetical protein MLD38_030524 [Melastoma candidum]|nr:hypothetical protein MLD38_030524 [Melastoma candidum]